MNDRQLITLTAALFAAMGDVESPDEAMAEALKLWYYAGGETGPRLPEEGPRDHIRNALAIIATSRGSALDVEQTAAVQRRLEHALAALESNPPSEEP